MMAKSTAWLEEKIETKEIKQSGHPTSFRIGIPCSFLFCQTFMPPTSQAESVEQLFQPLRVRFGVVIFLRIEVAYTVAQDSADILGRDVANREGLTYSTRLKPWDSGFVVPSLPKRSYVRSASRTMPRPLLYKPFRRLRAGRGVPRDRCSSRHSGRGRGVRRRTGSPTRGYEALRCL